LRSKLQINNLLKFRIVRENLLYTIGLPIRMADEDLLKSKQLFGQFGRVRKVKINENPKDGLYEGHIAVYVEYDHPLCVAVAILVRNYITLTLNLVPK
jgi:hypothetical protein